MPKSDTLRIQILKDYFEEPGKTEILSTEAATLWNIGKVAAGQRLNEFVKQGAIRKIVFKHQKIVYKLPLPTLA